MPQTEEQLQFLRLSVSKVKTFVDCNKKYHFGYILKLPQKERDYHVFGKFLHKVLENFHKFFIENKTNEPHYKVMGRVYKSVMLEYKSKMTPEMQQEAYEIIRSYLEKLANEGMPNVLSVEKDFNLNISEIVNLNGMIDRVQLDPDGIIHVADYKTIKNKKYLKNDFFQLLTYAFIIFSENKNIEKVRGSYILLRHNFELIEKEFSKEEILEIKDKYEDYAKSITSEKLWRPKVSPLCAHCSFLENCSDGQEFLNRGKKNVNVNGKVNW